MLLEFISLKKKVLDTLAGSIFMPRETNKGLNLSSSGLKDRLEGHIEVWRIE